ncbi:MAG: hypothetical protein B6D55_02925 [Candidatus Omnitrophica bacterium 4484_70.2]|nr:MAG: hypothetical protein B6D55_02925 [Candidatus Omnitrophica bacterium 4484_70.2]
MEIINAHVHIIEVDKIKEKEKYLNFLKEIPSFSNIDQVLNILSPEAVLKQMEEAKIKKCVILACYAPIIYASNEFVAEVCKKFPEKFIGFASVNPHDEEAPQKLERAIKNLGLSGLKLHPPLQNFYPHEKKYWPIYEKAEELNIPVIFHVGSTPFGSLVKLSQANPLLIDEIAINFPNLKIILTHLGTLWHNETFMVAEKNPNVYIDTSCYPYEMENLLNEELIKRVGEDKFIFGTDFPMPYQGKLHSMKEYVDCINKLNIPSWIKEKIFYKNFENLMKK